MIQRLVNIELKRAVYSRGFWISLIIGLSISIIHIIHNLVGVVGYWNQADEVWINSFIYPETVFSHWIGGNTYNIEGFLYFMIFPILAVLPCSAGFYDEIKDGYFKQVFTRCCRSDFLISKYLVTFLMGGIVIVVPLILNLMICMTMLQSLVPQEIAGKLVNASVLWYGIYETHPYMYLLIFFVLEFVFGGMMACLSLMLTWFSDKKIVALLFPFLLNIFIYSVCMMTGHPDAVKYSPVYFLLPAIGCPSWMLLIGYLIVLGGVSGYIFFQTGKKTDLY